MTSKQHKNEAIIPFDTENDKSAIEIARVWAAGGKQHLVLRTTVWSDPIAWGLMLVDLAKHAANTYEEDKKHSLTEKLARVKEGFDSEWETPSANRGGRTYTVVGTAKRNLDIPPEAENDDRARELIRIWESGGKQHVTLQAGLWADPFIWGVMLADLAEHVAKGYAKDGGQSVAHILARIKKGVDVEWANPTDTVSGKLL